MKPTRSPQTTHPMIPRIMCRSPKNVTTPRRDGIVHGVRDQKGKGAMEWACEEGKEPQALAQSSVGRGHLTLKAAEKIGAGGAIVDATPRTKLKNMRNEPLGKGTSGT